MVVEGRDIGTVVVPDAGLKIYLTADAQERARRRYHQNAGARARAGVSGVPAETAQHETDLAAVALDLDRRDTKDSTRANAPLQAAPDAVVIDSSQMAVEETVAQVLGLAAERGIR
jgi:cytidylate kinase